MKIPINLFKGLKEIFAFIVCILFAESAFSQENSGAAAPADSVKENRLDEVIVLGYGSTTKESFTGSIKKVDAKNIATKNVSNLSSALAGEVAGVTVLSTSGQPGTVGTIRVRGFGSINGSRDPLYVVDGVPFLGNVSSINPGDIASITVLKDATAVAIYGTRGSNGVVLIATKSGKKSAPYVEVEQRIGFNTSLPRYQVISSPEEYTELAWEALYNRGVIDPNISDPSGYANENLFDRIISSDYNIWQAPGDSLIDPATRKFRPDIARRYTPERWSDVALRNPLRSETNVRLGQGSDKTSYYISLGYLDDKGYLIETSFQRYTATLNLSHKIRNWLSGGANISYGFTDFKNNGQAENSSSIFWFLDNIPPIYPVYLRDLSGSIVPDSHYGGNQYDIGRDRGFSQGANPIADAKLSSKDTKSHNVTGSLNLDIAFTKWLSLENRLGAQYNSSLQTDFNNPFYGFASGQGGSIYKSNNEALSYNILNLLRFKHGFGKHNIEIAAAHEFNYYEARNLEASKYNLALPFIRDLNNAVVTSPSYSYTEGSSIESYFAQLNYDYKEKYFFSATFRRDGSSVFLNNKWGNFGSIGFAWAVHKEAFMSGQHMFSNLKLKASYGSIGNQSLSYANLYPGYDVYNINNLGDNPAISFSSIGNPDLTWETSRTFQVGTEFSIKRYVDVAIDYYYKLTDNLFYPRNVGPSSGYTSILTNEAALVNQAVEFDITGHIVDKKSWLLDVSVNGQFISSRIDYLPIDLGTGKEKKIDIVSPFARSKGSSIYDYYLREWAGVDPQTGSPMWNLYYDDLNRDNVAQNAEKIRSLNEYSLKGGEIRV